MSDACLRTLQQRRRTQTFDVGRACMKSCAARWASPDQKTDPAVAAKLALDGLFAGGPEVLADNLSRTAKAQLSGA
jgi:hypothetical protein